MARVLAAAGYTQQSDRVVQQVLAAVRRDDIDSSRASTLSGLASMLGSSDRGDQAGDVAEQALTYMPAIYTTASSRCGG